MKLFNITIGNVQLSFHNVPKEVIEFYKKNIYYSNKKSRYSVNVYFDAVFPKNYHVIKDKLGNKIALNFSEIGNKKLSVYADEKINLIYLHNLIIEQIIRILALQDDKMFLHASSLQINKNTIVVCGKRKSGKTNFYLGLLKKGCSFISDDLSLVNMKYILPYKKTVNLFAYNFETYGYLLNKTKLNYRLLFLLATKAIRFIKSVPMPKKAKKKLVHLAYASTNLQVPANKISNTIRKPVKMDIILILNKGSKRISKISANTAIKLLSVISDEDRKEFMDIYRKSRQSSEIMKRIRVKEQNVLKKILKNKLIYTIPNNIKPLAVVKGLRI